MSLHGRLLRLLMLAVMPLVVMCGAGVYFFVRGALIASLDDGLIARARTLSASVKLEPEGIELDATPELLTHYADPVGPEFYEIRRLDHPADQPPVFSSASLGHRTLGAHVQVDEQEAWSGVIEDGPSVRLAGVRVQIARQPVDADDPPVPPETEAFPSDGVAMLVVVARADHELRSTLALLATALGASGLILTLGTWFAVRAALARGLLPIDCLADEIAAIRPNDPAARVGTQRLPRELAPLGQHTNGLLDRVQAALRRERALAASAAHEIRTPIAEIRATSELALQRQRSADEYRSSLATVLDAAGRMGDSAAAVLRLSRIQSGKERLSLETIELLEALGPAWARWVEPLAARGVNARLDIPASATAPGEPGMLGVVIENLCANIAEHTPSHGTVDVEWVASPAHKSVLRFSNSQAACNGAAPASGPDTRIDHPLHAGLGLVIARQMMQAMGGVLHVIQTDSRYIATLEWPLVPDPRK